MEPEPRMLSVPVAAAEPVPTARFPVSRTALDSTFNVAAEAALPVLASVRPLSVPDAELR